MSLKDAFSGLKEELGKDLQSEEKQHNNEDESNLTSSVNKSSETEIIDNSGSNEEREQKEESASAKEITNSTPANSSRQRKRKIGKRSDPDFTQAPAFIRRITHQQVKINLITDPDFNDYSELVEALLVQWLEKKKEANL